MTILVDTNVLVYDAIENSPHHDNASNLIDKSGDPLINSLLPYISKEGARMGASRIYKRRLIIWIMPY